MVFLDTDRWRPRLGHYRLRARSESDDTRHHWAPDAMIDFPPKSERRPLLQGQPRITWTAAMPLSDYNAFQTFGPAGRIEDDATSEPAQLWQDAIDLIRSTFEANWTATPGGRFVACGGATDGLRAALASATNCGDIYTGWEGIRPAMRARTLGAWLAADLAEDLAAKRRCRHLRDLRAAHRIIHAGGPGLLQPGLSPGRLPHQEGSEKWLTSPKAGWPVFDALARRGCRRCRRAPLEDV